MSDLDVVFYFVFFLPDVHYIFRQNNNILCYYANLAKNGHFPSRIPALVSHEIGSHFIEQLICAATEELYEDMLEKHFMPHLQLMALHPVANFVLQRIITEAHTCEQACYIK